MIKRVSDLNKSQRTSRVERKDSHSKYLSTSQSNAMLKQNTSQNKAKPSRSKYQPSNLSLLNKTGSNISMVSPRYAQNTKSFYSKTKKGVSMEASSRDPSHREQRVQQLNNSRQSREKKYSKQNYVTNHLRYFKSPRFFDPKLSTSNIMKQFVSPSAKRAANKKSGN